MPEQKYQDIKVSQRVYVNSLSQYHFTVYGDCGRKTYALGFGFDDWSHPPAYLVRNVENQIADMLENGTARFFERDQDGNERYEGLRYHDPELVKSMIPSLRNPEPSLYDRPRHIGFIVLLLRHSDFYILRKKREDHKRWDCYLLKPEGDPKDGVGIVYQSLTHDEVELAMPWLKMIRNGVNDVRETWQEFTAS